MSCTACCSRSPAPSHSARSRGSQSSAGWVRGDSCHGAVLCCGCCLPGAPCWLSYRMVPHTGAALLCIVQTVLFPGRFSLSLPFSCSCSHQGSPYLCPFCPVSPEHFSCRWEDRWPQDLFTSRMSCLLPNLIWTCLRCE